MRFLRSGSGPAQSNQPGADGREGEVAAAETLIIDADLAEPGTAQAVVDPVLAALGRIDALLNIAGAVPQIDLFEMSDAQWDGGLALKLHGARRLTSRLGRRCERRKGPWY